LHLLRASPEQQTVVKRTHRPRPAAIPRSAFAGFCFPPDVIVLAVRWYLRFALSYRDVGELLTERGVQVDHVTVYRWCCGSRRCSPRPPGPADMPSAMAGRRDLKWRLGTGRQILAVAVDRMASAIDGEPTSEPTGIRRTRQ
jgi:hypothetical protein